jgi:hypothetical protein
MTGGFSPGGDPARSQATGVTPGQTARDFAYLSVGFHRLTDLGILDRLWLIDRPAGGYLRIPVGCMFPGPAGTVREGPEQCARA